MDAHNATPWKHHPGVPGRPCRHIAFVQRKQATSVADMRREEATCGTEGRRPWRDAAVALLEAGGADLSYRPLDRWRIRRTQSVPQQPHEWNGAGGEVLTIRRSYPNPRAVYSDSLVRISPRRLSAADAEVVTFQIGHAEGKTLSCRETADRDGGPRVMRRRQDGENRHMGLPFSLPHPQLLSYIASWLFEPEPLLGAESGSGPNAGLNEAADSTPLFTLGPGS